MNLILGLSGIVGMILGIIIFIIGINQTTPDSPWNWIIGCGTVVGGVGFCFLLWADVRKNTKRM